DCGTAAPRHRRTAGPRDCDHVVRLEIRVSSKGPDVSMASDADRFQLVTDFELRGDQARAQDELVEGLARGDRHQVLLRGTRAGKTFTMAQVVSRTNRPTLVMAHNKTLAAQLYQEFKRFFPHNAVEYFVSYYDYYQPE